MLSVHGHGDNLVADPPIFPISRARKVRVRGSAEYYRMMVLTNRNFVVTINRPTFSNLEEVGRAISADPPKIDGHNEIAIR